MSEEFIVQFSGGKDSRAVLHLLRGWRNKGVVFFVNTGAMFPHVERYVRETCKDLGFRLEEIKPDLPVRVYIDIMGHPSDITSTWNNPKIYPYLTEKPETKLNDAMECCYANLMAPLHRATIASGIKTVYRGSKKADSKVGVPDGFVDEHGIKYRSPLWNWTEHEVFNYLEANMVKLLDHYPHVKDSTQCYLCTADLWYSGAERIEYIKKVYPELWPEVEERLSKVKKEVDKLTNKFTSSIEKVLG